MNVHQFITSRRGGWRELEEFVQQASRLSLARVPLDDFRRGSLRYRQTADDLSYARMRFPRHAVVRELEALLGRAHSAIYQARRTSSTSWVTFFRSTWPAAVRGAAPHILLATCVFWVFAFIGFVMAAANPVIENLFVSPSMRESIESGHLWTEHITSVAPQTGSAIAQNNISVALLAWGLGMTFGVGTLWLLATNGIMLGVIFVACMRHGMSAALAEFVVAHGCLELPAIWIAAGAGFVLAEPLVFPKRYRRGVEMRLAARCSVRLVLGLIPMLLLAALVEAFISPSSLPGPTKAGVGAALAAAYLIYIITAPTPDEAEAPSQVGPSIKRSP